MFKRIGLKRLGRALGFTLIEMGIVLVVIGLILSGGLVAVAPVVQNAKINETNVKLDRIEQALIVYTIQNHCLPCPALPSEADSTGTAGQAYTTATTHSPTGCAATTCDPLVATQGVVPWVNLGLSEDDTTDAFGGRISYAVTPALVPAAGMDRVPSVSYPAGTLQVRYDGTNHVTDVAAYVLWSTGPNQAVRRQRLWDRIGVVS